MSPHITHHEQQTMKMVKTLVYHHRICTSQLGLLIKLKLRFGQIEDIDSWNKNRKEINKNIIIKSYQNYYKFNWNYTGNDDRVFEPENSRECLAWLNWFKLSPYGEQKAPYKKIQQTFLVCC